MPISSQPSRSPATGHPRRGPLAAAALALLLAAGCAGRGSGGASPAPPTLTAPATVTAGQPGYQAAVTAQAGAAYAFTVTNGTITHSDGGPAIRFTAGSDPARPLTLACTVTRDGQDQTCTTQSTVRQGPLILTLGTLILHQGAETASTPPVAGSSYAWSVTGGTLLSGQGTPRITFLPSAGAASASRLQAPRPLAATGNVVLTLTETDATGASQTTTLELPAAEDSVDPPAGLAYAPAETTAMVGKEIAGIIASSDGGSITSYQVSPALPDGLSVDPDTGAIAGIPKAAAPAATYTVTAGNAAGSASASFNLTVNDQAPAAFSYPSGTAGTDVGTPLGPLAPSFADGGGPATGFRIDPPLPAGLVLGPDGSIAGTPTASLAAPDYLGTYTVTASNSGGSSTATVTLAVRPAAPTVAIAPGSLSLLAGQVGTLTASPTGAPPYAYAWTRNSAPLDAAGATLRLPAAIAAGSYQVTVKDALGRQAPPSNVATITVDPPLPRFLYLGHGDGTLSMFTADGATGHLRPHGFAGLDSIPDLLATTPDGRFLASADKAGRTLSMFALDATSGRPVQAGPALDLPGLPQQILVEPSGTWLYVLWQATRNGLVSGTSISAFAIAADGALTAAAGLPPGIFPTGVQPASMVADPLGRFLIVADSSFQVRCLAIGAGGALARAGSAVAGGARAPVLAVNPAGTRVYALSAGGEANPSPLAILGYPLGDAGLAPNTGTPGTGPSGMPPASAAFDGTGATLYLLTRDPTQERLPKIDAYQADPDTGLLAYDHPAIPVAATTDFVLEPTGHLIYSITDIYGLLSEMSPDEGAEWFDSLNIRPAATTLALAPGRAALRHGTGPGYMALPATNQVVGVSFDPRTGVPAGMPSNPLATLAAVPAGSAPDTAGTRLYVFGAKGAAGTIDTFAIDADGSLAATGPSSLPGLTRILDLATDPTDTYAAVVGTVTGGSRLLLFRLDPLTGAPGTLLATRDLVAASPARGAVRFDPRGRFLYVQTDLYLQYFAFDWRLGSLATLYPPKDMTESLPSGSYDARPFTMHPNGTNLYVPLADTAGTGQDQVLRILLDPETGYYQGFISRFVGPQVMNVAVSPDDFRVWAYCAGTATQASEVVAIDQSGNGDPATWILGAFNAPGSVGLDPAGRFLYTVTPGGLVTPYPLTDPLTGEPLTSNPGPVPDGAITLGTGRLSILDRLR